ncbi:hypothetical protein ABZW30_39545 [Kitasatospora sp. NPDC004669]|uniref:hypothetical protein n=1 Tax=Kitasatospora sp. NPDC004669 TaxID=3154555 RepID=UPI00339E9A6F
MSGNNPRFHVGDQVTIHGGHHNVGVQHNNGPVGDQALPPEIAAMFAQLAAVVAELARDSRVHEEDRQSLTEALPVLRDPASEERRGWRNTLLLLAGVTQSIGEAAAPALGLANQLLALISG